MKKSLPTIGAGLVLASSLFAGRHDAVIFGQQKELVAKVAAWEKQCGDKVTPDETCIRKRAQLRGELNQFLASINDELTSIRRVVPNPPADWVKKTEGRLKVMEFNAHNTEYIIKCLGVPQTDPQCRAEAAAIDKEKAVIDSDYKDTLAEFSTAGFDGKWISLRQ